MADVDKLILQVLPVADSDAEELADLAGELHAELLGVDAVSVDPLSAEGAPEGAKGLGTLAGWLIAQVGTLDGLRAAVAAATGTGRFRVGGLISLRRRQLREQSVADSVNPQQRDTIAAG